MLAMAKITLYLKVNYTLWMHRPYTSSLQHLPCPHVMGSTCRFAYIFKPG